MSGPSLITVLIADDHAVVRHGIRGYLEAHDDLVVVGEAASGDEAMRLAEELVPDVVLMDLVMPGLDGVAATAAIRELSPRSQVVVLTSFHDDNHIFPAIRAGASAYILKDITPAALAEAVRAAARGESTLHPQVAARLLQESRQSGPEDLHDPTRVQRSGLGSESRPGPLARPRSESRLDAGLAPGLAPPTRLTAREIEVLKLIAEGLANAQIADRLVLSEKTVKGHVSNILAKLHLADRTQAAVFAWREGVVGRGT